MRQVASQDYRIRIRGWCYPVNNLREAAHALEQACDFAAGTIGNTCACSLWLRYETQEKNLVAQSLFAQHAYMFATYLGRQSLRKVDVRMLGVKRSRPWSITIFRPAIGKAAMAEQCVGQQLMRRVQFRIERESMRKPRQALHEATGVCQRGGVSLGDFCFVRREPHGRAMACQRVKQQTLMA